MDAPLSPQSFNSNLLTRLPRDPLHSLAVLARLLESGEFDGDVVLIGGQALYIWSLRYNDCGFSELDQTYLTSYDIDYVVKVGHSIQLLAHTWGARDYKTSTIDDITPQEALIHFVDVDSQNVVVDILNEVLGFKNKEDVIQQSERIPVEGTLIPLMNPIHCLKSRVANAFGRGLAQARLDREISRIRSAVKICRAYLSEMLDNADSDEQMKDSVKAVNYLLGYCRAREAKRTAKCFQINLAHAIPTNHPKLNCIPYCIFIEKSVQPTILKLDAIIQKANN